MDTLQRNAIRFDKFPTKKWKNGIIPYIVSPLYNVDERIEILSAIRHLNLISCLQFQPWNGISSDYLVIWPMLQPAGCWSYVGRQGGKQILSLQRPEVTKFGTLNRHCFKSRGHILHELLHASGLLHEQSRSDRDSFIKIHWNHIRKLQRYRKNFEKESISNVTKQFDYDFTSVMHYGEFFFSLNKSKPTITIKRKLDTLRLKRHGLKLGQRIGLSRLDCLKLNELYNCLQVSDIKKRKIFRICELFSVD